MAKPFTYSTPRESILNPTIHQTRKYKKYYVAGWLEPTLQKH